MKASDKNQNSPKKFTKRKIPQLLSSGNVSESRSIEVEGFEQKNILLASQLKF